MVGLWLENRRLELREQIPVPQLPAGEARVRVRLAGICNTDLELVRGYYPYCGIPGHEFVGEVESGPESWMGRRVVGEINASCTQCPVCRAGRARHCERRTVLGIVNRHGAFAEYLTLPVRNLHHVPDSVSDEAAVFTEPLAAALEIQEQVGINPDEQVLVVGDGKLGQLIARSLALIVKNLTVLGRHRHKLKMLDELGIDTRTSGRIPAGRFDLVVECTGNSEGFKLALRALRPQGTLVMKSTYAGKLEVDASSLVVNEIHLVGSRCGPFAPALRLLEESKIDPTPLIEARYPLREGRAAFEHAKRRGALKIILEP